MENNLTLRAVEEKDKENRQIYEMLQSIGRKESGFENNANGLSFDEYGDFIKQRVDYSKGINLLDIHVPELVFWLFDGDEVVGYAKLRTKLNENLKLRGGHVGYAIRKEKRGRGYGKEILKLLLNEARKINLREVLLTCNPENIASRKIIEKNGGGLKNETVDTAYYIIEL